MSEISEEQLISREKTWDERDAVEQLEALREQVVYLTNVLHRQWRIINGLERHDHLNSRVVIGIENDHYGEPSLNYGRSLHAIPMGLRDKE